MCSKRTFHMHLCFLLSYRNISAIKVTGVGKLNIHITLYIRFSQVIVHAFKQFRHRTYALIGCHCGNTNVWK